MWCCSNELYLGATHGVASILYVLLHFWNMLTGEQKSLVRACCLQALALEAEAHYPVVLPDPAKTSEAKVRWVTRCSTNAQCNLCDVSELRVTRQRPGKCTRVVESLQGTMKTRNDVLKADMQARRLRKTPTPGPAQEALLVGPDTLGGSKRVTNCCRK